MAKITPKTAERLSLLHHGTQPASLSANAILQTAQADLRRKRKPCFLKKHVKDANAASDILRKAVEEYRDGIGASDVNTARVYSNLDTLKLALAKALQDGM
ncbi:MAG: hypothetical protein ACR2RF_26205 [Geminicoccaceae bacterium]